MIPCIIPEKKPSFLIFSGFAFMMGREFVQPVFSRAAPYPVPGVKIRNPIARNRN
jgi:hypothetical protein